jgi:hypothetical protein
MDNFSVEDLLSADQNNFAISYDNIGKVELKKFGKGAFIDIIANRKRYHWNVRGIPDVKNPRIEDLEKNSSADIPRKTSKVELSKTVKRHIRKGHTMRFRLRKRPQFPRVNAKKRREWDSNPRGPKDHRLSRPARYPLCHPGNQSLSGCRSISFYTLQKN